MLVSTIGYKGTTLDAFVAALVAGNVARVIDVRGTARSRKRDFNKNRLRDGLEAAGIEYVHLPAVGAPKEPRARYLETGNWPPFAAAYEEFLHQHPEALGELETLAAQRPSALACLCPDAARCHRGILAARLADRGARVRHLTPALESSA